MVSILWGIQSVDYSSILLDVEIKSGQILQKMLKNNRNSVTNQAKGMFPISLRSH